MRHFYSVSYSIYVGEGERRRLVSCCSVSCASGSVEESFREVIKTAELALADKEYLEKMERLADEMVRDNERAIEFPREVDRMVG